MVLEIRIESEFENVSSSGKRKTGVNGEKPLGGWMRTNDKLVTHVKLSLGFGLEPNWWKLSASAVPCC